MNRSNRRFMAALRGVVGWKVDACWEVGTSISICRGVVNGVDPGKGEDYPSLLVEWQLRGRNSRWWKPGRLPRWARGGRYYFDGPCTVARLEADRVLLVDDHWLILQFFRGEHRQ